MRRLPPTIERNRMLEDYGHSTIEHNGRLRPVVTIKPIDNWRIPVDPDTMCPVCKANLRNEPHDLDPHRQAIGLDRPVEDEEYRQFALDRAMRRHPAGSRLTTGQRGQHRDGE